MDSKLKLLRILYEIEDVWQFKLTSIDDRKTLQKLIYFLQEFGGSTRYTYNLYVKGPYSPELTRDAFGLQTIDQYVQNLVRDKVPLNKEDFESICRLRAFVQGFNCPLDLEILSTMHYLYNHAYMPKRTKEAIFREFASQKPEIARRSDLERFWHKLESDRLVGSYSV